MKCARENALRALPMSAPFAMSSGCGTRMPLASSAFRRIASVSANCGIYTEAVSATMSFSKRSNSSAPFLTESSESAASWHGFAFKPEGVNYEHIPC